MKTLKLKLALMTVAIGNSRYFYADKSSEFSRRETLVKEEIHSNKWKDGSKWVHDKLFVPLIGHAVPLHLLCLKPSRILWGP